MEEYMLPCTGKRMFGIDCVGCGIQRALALLMEGDFKGAFYMYPAIYTLLIFVTLLGIHFIDKKRNYHRVIVVTAIVNAVIMIGSYLYKAIHFQIFN